MQRVCDFIYASLCKLIFTFSPSRTAELLTVGSQCIMVGVALETLMQIYSRRPPSHLHFVIYTTYTPHHSYVMCVRQIDEFAQLQLSDFEGGGDNPSCRKSNVRVNNIYTE